MPYKLSRHSPFRTVRVAWSKLPVRYRGVVVVAIPASCLLITLGCWVWSREAVLLIRRDIEGIQGNLFTSSQILTQNLNAETGVRGYTITRDPIFLEPFAQAEANLEPAIQTLEAAERSTQKEQVQAIKRLSQQNMASLQQVIDEISGQAAINPPSINRLIATSKQTMDRLRLAVSDFQQQQQQQLESFIQQREKVQEATSAALWFTAIISALGSWAAIYLFMRLDQDLSDREQRLRESSSLLNAIVTSVVDGVVVLDELGRIDSFNPTASRLFGYQPKEVLGKDLYLLFAEPEAQKTDASLEAAITTGQTWQTSGLRSDGSTFPISVSISDVQLHDHRLIVIIRDMSEVQQTQAKLESRAKELTQMSAILAQTNILLEDRNRELEQFAYVASHDLKAPLRAIANLSEWIEEDLAGQLPPENQQQMVLLRGRVHRMEALINGLLEYSRVGRTHAPLETVSVPTLVDEILDSLDPPATFTIELAPDLPTFKTKMLLLRQVFANLLSNAIKHHDRADGRIQVQVNDQETFYEFIVRDDGPGIHPDYHDKIFTIFQTLQARDVKESTGIGLAIVKKVVETEGGTIWVDSQEGQGAAFHFTWRKSV
ncbi:MAG: ATP-binding protein [Leptolyngbyaceae cyanobacterium bins.302]|nr:ATP-binding protein [Leptolyngbyaceae cyanobacterium bins.302]